MTDVVSGVPGYVAQLQSEMSSLPSALQQAAPTGSFGAVFASLQAAMSQSTTAASSTPTTSTAATTPTTSTGTATTSGVVQDALSYLGTPYVWGGTTPAGFDCSGFTQYVYNEQGISIPRTSEEQAQVGTPVDSIADAEPGDLVFFAGSDGTASSPGHVGIYLGNGEMVDAPETGENVQIQPVGDPVAIRRIIPSSQTPQLATTASATTTASTESTGSVSVPPSLAPSLLSAAATYGVPAQLLAAVAQVESGFNVNAVSSAGAEGVMQIMPSTAQGLGIDPTDPAQAFDGAAEMLSGYLKQFGSVPLALAAYNAGPNAVTQYGGIPPYPQTQSYVNDVMSLIGGSTS